METLLDSISHEPQHDDIMDYEDYSQNGSEIGMEGSQEDMEVDNMANYPCTDLLELWLITGVLNLDHT